MGLILPSLNRCHFQNEVEVKNCMTASCKFILPRKFKNILMRSPNVPSIICKFKYYGLYVKRKLLISVFFSDRDRYYEREPFYLRRCLLLGRLNSGEEHCLLKSHQSEIQLCFSLLLSLVEQLSVCQERPLPLFCQNVKEMHIHLELLGIG